MNDNHMSERAVLSYSLLREMIKRDNAAESEPSHETEIEQTEQENSDSERE
jgi:hypothetical protein